MDYNDTDRTYGSTFDIVSEDRFNTQIKTICNIFSLNLCKCLLYNRIDVFKVPNGH